MKSSRCLNLVISKTNRVLNYKPGWLLGLMAVCVVAGTQAFAQSEPNLEIGFKPYGSYHGTPVDSINLMNGGVTHHIPLPMQYPERGGRLNNSFLITNNSKNWNVQFNSTSDILYWAIQSASNPQILGTLWPSLSRDVLIGHESSIALAYSITTWEGGNHPVTDVSGNGSAFAAVDGTGWHVLMSNPDSSGIYQNAILIDREGNQFAVSGFTGPCSPASTSNSGLSSGPGFVQCQQKGFSTGATDSNGNVYNVSVASLGYSPDTMGRTLAFAGQSSSTSGSSGSSVAGCTSSVPISLGLVMQYPGYGGASNQITICYGNINIATNFGVSEVTGNGTQSVEEYPSNNSGSGPFQEPVQILLPDGSQWTFGYDSYGNVISLGLPLGGSISYQYAAVAFPVLNGAPPVSRAVTQRTITDNNGHTYVWKYQWMPRARPEATALSTVIPISLLILPRTM